MISLNKYGMTQTIIKIESRDGFISRVNLPQFHMKLKYMKNFFLDNYTCTSARSG